MNHHPILPAVVPFCVFTLLAPVRGAEPAATLDPMIVSTGRLDGADTLTQRDLDLFQAESVADLSGLRPGLHVVTSDTRGYGDVLSLRGSANTLFFSPPAVGMVIDDVPMGDVFSYPSGLMELEQLLVLRGPQGAAYGPNAAAGMIEMMTPRPGANNEFRFGTEYGSYDSWGAKLYSGGPLGGDFSHTLQLYGQGHDGYIHNRTLGDAVDDRSLYGGLANLYWRPADDTEVRLRVLAERADDGAARLSLLGSPDPFQVTSEIPGTTELERQQVSLHITKETPWGRFKSITAWQQWQLDPSIVDLDLAASLPPMVSSSTILQEQAMWSQEFRWESPEDAGPWSWRSGLFLLDKSTDGDARRAFPVEPFPLFLPGFFVPFWERTRYTIDDWSVAGYGRVSYEVDDRLTLRAGARLEYASEEIRRKKTDGFGGSSVVQGKVDDWYLSPELGASYQVCENTSLYARSAIGIKPAGFSAFASTPATAGYDDETAWTNELGVNVSLPEQNLGFSVAGFWNRIEDYQVNRPDVASTDYFTVNADRVTSLGLEGELRWQPVDGLTVQASAGYVHAEFDSYQDPVAPGVWYNGNAVPFVPEFTGALGLRYDFPNGFYAQTALRAVGETFFNEANQAAFRQGTWWRWDAEIGYAREDFSVALYGLNLLDEEYYTFINPQIAAGSPGDPQLFGVRVRVGF